MFAQHVVPSPPSAALRGTTDHGPRTTDHGPRTRSAFTLVELLMAVVIISILLALLIPAVASVMTRARDGRVRAEISSLEMAIASFKATYGVDPPSRITLCTDRAQWNANPQSRAAIRRIWPDFDFGDGTAFSGTGGLPNSLFPSGDPVTLYGDECLVFFLGGVASADGALSGFSVNPARPFIAPTVATAEEVRKGPFFDFDVSRLAQSQDSLANPTTKGPALAYLDPQAVRSGSSNGYLYINSDGRSYDPATHFPPRPGNPSVPVMRDVYRTGPGATAAPHKPKGYQLIAPGADGLYGQGGYFDPQNANSSLSGGNRVASGAAGYDAAYDNPEYERDNITNFHSGRLAP